jgi:hypothetical protein
MHILAIGGKPNFMVPWWKRLILSLVSVIAADVVCCTGMIFVSERGWKTLFHLFAWLLFATPFAFIPYPAVDLLKSPGRIDW